MKFPSKIDVKLINVAECGDGIDCILNGKIL